MHSAASANPSMPITPGSRPTAAPDASTALWAQVAASRSITGVRAIRIAFASRSSRNPQPSKMISAAIGGLLCYCWVGYTVDRALHGPGHALAHSVFVAVALGIAAWAGLRARRDGSSAQGAPQFAGELAAA